jgi:ketosteroid isomerase-like protein
MLLRAAWSSNPDYSSDTCRSMSRENVELVKALQPTNVDLVEFVSANEGADQGGLDAIPAAAFADDFEVRFIASGMQLQEYRGVQGLAQGWRDWLIPWASYRLDAEDFIDMGDAVVVFARVRGRTARDDVLVEHAPAAIWSIREGKVAAIRFYLDRDEALEAAGLREQSR